MAGYHRETRAGLFLLTISGTPLVDNLYSGPDQDLVRAVLQSEALLPSQASELHHAQKGSLVLLLLLPFIFTGGIPNKSAPLICLSICLLENLS